MGFEADVKETPHLNDAFRAGLQALGSKSSKVSLERGVTLVGSVDIDSALVSISQYANANRWDYAVAESTTNGDVIHWIEIHPASEGEVESVLAKHDWLKNWLAGDATRLDYRNERRKFVWIASGKTRITPTGSGARKLAKRGVRFVGGHYRIDLFE
jgi:hypothetical protein